MNKYKKYAVAERHMGRSLQSQPKSSGNPVTNFINQTSNNRRGAFPTAPADLVCGYYPTKTIGVHRNKSAPQNIDYSPRGAPSLREGGGPRQRWWEPAWRSPHRAIGAPLQYSHHYNISAIKPKNFPHVPATCKSKTTFCSVNGGDVGEVLGEMVGLYEEDPPAFKRGVFLIKVLLPPQGP